MVVRVRKTVSVLFADVVGSTSLGERVDPEAMRNALERYFDAMRVVVEGHGGTVEKFVGDAVLAVFGIPSVHEDDALRAVRAAVAMRDELERLRPELGVELRARIGINTGEVVTGEGDTFATGDTMNVAARLEQYAEPDEILIGASTQELVSDAVQVERLEPLSLKGKAEPVAAFRLLGVLADPPHERPLVGPFVGRRPELTRLVDELAATVEDGSCRMVVVTGEAGIGKSRLVREFALRTAGEARLLIGRCLSYGEGITYWPLRDVVHQLAGAEPLPELTRLLGDSTVAETIAGAIGATTTSAATSGEIQWSVRRLLEALAANQPLVLVLDDLHWAEPAFLDLVDYLHGFIRSSPVLLIATGRPELIDARPGWRSFSLELSPLSENEAAELVDGLTNGSANDLSARVVESAEGNPLFLEQFCAMVAESGELMVSPSIQGLLAARIDQLPAQERAVAERGAIEGRLFHRGAVSELSPAAARPDVAARLSSLVRRDLVRPAESLFVGDDGYRFAHALVREAVYSATPKVVRAELHEQFAAWAERTSDTGPGALDEILGYHLERACRYRKELGLVDAQTTALGARAAERLAAAGRRAYQRGDIAAATGLLTRAASLWEPDALPRLAMLPDLGAALNMSGELVRADEVLTEAIDRTADAAKPIHARALIERSIVRGQMSVAEWAVDNNALATSTIPILEEAGDHVGLAKAWKLLGLRHVHAEFLYEQARPKLERALDHARLAQDGPEQGELQIWLGAVIVYGRTPVEEGLVRAQTALARAKGRTEIATGTTVLALLEAMHGRFDEARGLATEAKEIYGELGLGLFAAAMGNVWGPIQLLAGDPAAAEEELRHSYDELARIGEKGYLSSVAGWLARALYAQGRDHEAERFAAICAETGGPDDRITQLLWRTTRARVLARRGECADAESLARDAVKLVESTDALEAHADTLVDLAEVLRLAGRADEAIPVLHQALQLYEQKGVVPSIAKTRRLLETAGIPGLA